MRISDWSSDVCSSDLPGRQVVDMHDVVERRLAVVDAHGVATADLADDLARPVAHRTRTDHRRQPAGDRRPTRGGQTALPPQLGDAVGAGVADRLGGGIGNAACRARGWQYT